MTIIRALASAAAAGALLVGGFATTASADASTACSKASDRGVSKIKQCRVSYAVRMEAVKGQDPESGTLRISCPTGYELSPPTSEYFITFGAIAPDGYNGPTSSVTRTLRTATSYEIDYTLDPEAPIGSGIYLVGTCVPV
jgi:hypothetical protein